VKLSAGFSVRQTWALIDAHAPEGDGAEHRCLIVAGPCRPNASDNPHELIRQAHALWIGAVYLGSSGAAPAGDAQPDHQCGWKR
jgi:hypothetical protein